MGTLFGVWRGFDLFDLFLKFLLIDFVEKFSSFEEEEVVEIMNGLAVGGVGCDFLAIGKQGIEFFVKKGTNVGGKDSGTHKNLHVN